MAVVIAQYFKPNRQPKAAAKENVKYIQFRKGKDREGITRTLFGSDGPMTRLEAYQFIDEAPKGTKLYTIIISPDPKREDHSRDLDMEQIASTTMQTVEERVKTAVQWVAAVHQEHSDVRHIHALAAVKGRLTPPDLRALIASATRECREQRLERDLILEKHARTREQEQEGWEPEPTLEEERWDE
jgi:hypothetical protein